MLPPRRCVINHPKPDTIPDSLQSARSGAGSGEAPAPPHWRCPCAAAPHCRDTGPNVVSQHLGAAQYESHSLEGMSRTPIREPARARSGAGIHGPAVPTAPAFDTVARFDGRSKSLPPASTIATGSGSRSKPLSPGSAKPSQPEPALGCGSSAAIQRRAIRRGTTRSAAAARPMGDHARGPASRRCDRQSSNIATIFP